MQITAVAAPEAVRPLKVTVLDAVSAAAVSVPVNVGEIENTNSPVPVEPVEVTPSTKT